MWLSLKYLKWSAVLLKEKNIKEGGLICVNKYKIMVIYSKMHIESDTVCWRPENVKDELSDQHTSVCVQGEKQCYMQTLFCITLRSG